MRHQRIVTLVALLAAALIAVPVAEAGPGKGQGQGGAPAGLLESSNRGGGLDARRFGQGRRGASGRGPTFRTVSGPFSGATGLPPGLAKHSDLPLGLTRRDSLPPGLAHGHFAPPGLAVRDVPPPGLTPQ